MRFATVTVPATTEFVRAAAQFIVQTARLLAVPAAASPLFEVAVVEALSNAVKHGSRDGAEAVISCEVERTAAGLTIRVYDAGQGYAPADHAAPPFDPATTSVADLPESGYGVPIIQSVFQHVDARREDGRFCLELTLVSALPLA